MSEMLGNHYFLVENYESACREFEKVTRTDTHNPAVLKKLIISYIKTGKNESALNLLYGSLLKDKSYFNDCLQNENCPRIELIQEVRDDILLYNRQKILALAILWFFRDKNTSKKYFRIIATQKEEGDDLQQILKIYNHLNMDLSLIK